jgi:hypothetical protein
MPFVSQPWNAWDFVALALVVLACAVMLLRRRLPPGLGVSILIASGSVAVGIACFRLKWPLTDPMPLVRRIAAAMCAVWAAFGWATRERESAAIDLAATDQKRLESSSCFFAGAMTTGLLAVILVIVPLVTALFARLVQRDVDELLITGVPDRQRIEGASDVVALLFGWFFWRLSARDRLQPVIAASLVALLVTWLSLMIPGGVLVAPSEAISLIPKPLSLPIWWTWSLNWQLGLALLVTAMVVLRERAFRRHRAAAWPLELERLIDPYPPWIGTPEAVAIFSAATVVLGVFHIVRPDAPQSPAGGLSLLACLMTAFACFYSAYRQWNENVAGLGLAAFATAWVTVFVVVWPDPPGLHYADVFPSRATAAVFGLVATSWFYFWMGDVWSQQVEDRPAWTTTGRIVPHARRAGFMLCALAVLVGFNMAIWPQTRIAIDRDDSASRWISGPLALALTAIVAGRFAGKRRDMSLAVIALASVAGMAVFAIVRLPPSMGDVRQFSPLILAAATLPILLMAESLGARARSAFARPLWIVALLLLPALALWLSTGRPPTPWLQPATFVLLSAVYAAAALREGRRIFVLPAIGMLVSAGVFLWKAYGFGAGT